MKITKKPFFNLIGDWGLGIGPIPNPQSPIPNPQSPFNNKMINLGITYLYIKY
jgi:hypothetical protein